MGGSRGGVVVVLDVGEQSQDGVAARRFRQVRAHEGRGDVHAEALTDVEVDDLGCHEVLVHPSRDRPEAERFTAGEEAGEESVQVEDLTTQSEVQDVPVVGESLFGVTRPLEAQVALGVFDHLPVPEDCRPTKPTCRSNDDPRVRNVPW